ncbi:MAG TPA: polyphosphate kinase 1 [Longimicrobiaceae bacterium]|nr:polyphosphate kinase 1 [Longimicrobiaceae bacterium]
MPRAPRTAPAASRHPTLPEPLAGGALAVRFTCPDAAALEALATGDLPAGMAAGPPVTTLFRDVYHDTPAGDLRRRGATVAVRIHPGGERTLAVEVRDGRGIARRSAATAAAGDDAELLAGSSAPARVLRALTDPARLVPWLEVEARRRTRAGSVPAAGGAVELELAGEELTVREHGLAVELREVEVRLGEDTAAGRAALRTLEEAFRLVLALGDAPDRWRRALDVAEAQGLAAAARGARRVAVVASRRGRVALLREGGTLRVPSAPGSGIEAARQVLGTVFRGTEGRVRLLGTGPGSPRGPATEVWLAEELDGASPISPGALVESAAHELLEAVESPALRDDATLAALHVLARSGLPLHPRAAALGALRTAPSLPTSIPAPGGEAATLPPGALLNMELSVLAFNRRVLELAADPRYPLLERVRYLSIYGGNLDEFFRVRVAGFKRQAWAGGDKRTLDGVTAREQLDAIGVRVRLLQERAYRLLLDELLPELAAQGIRVVQPGGLRRAERAWLREYYDREVHPLLTPLAAGPGYPFPHIRNQRPALVAVLREPLTGGERLGVVELPDGLPRFVPLEGGRRFVPLEAVVHANLHRLYPGTDVDAACTFRVTRSAELHLERSHVGDLLQAVEDEVQRRRFRPVVRLEVERGMPARLRAVLLRELQHEAPDRTVELGEEDLYPVERLIDLRGVRELAALPVPELRFAPEGPERPLDPEVPIMAALREREVLVHFPRDSFEDTVERLVLEAADDPEVVAIKLALYRTNRRSRLVESMRRASARGKQVVALVELTARFDEERNIEWARYLRSSGIQVVYGVPGLKIHAKAALVVRREEGGVRRYVYVGTGNLNATTAAAYTDLGLLSADPVLGEEVNHLFNVLTGASSGGDFRLLLAAPYNLRGRFLEMIEREAEHARSGRRGHIAAKMNGLADRELIAALYGASRAGVTIDLIVRGICALRPGVAGLSENIRVVSVLGRYLEHARIFRFANRGDPEYYIGSADWRTRNLSHRVEVAAPVRDPAHRAELDAILDAQLEAPDAWELGSDGTYYRRPEPPPRDPVPAADPERVAIATGGTS